MTAQNERVSPRLGDLADTLSTMRRPDQWLPKLTARQVRIHTRDDRTLQGALVAVYDDALVLENATYVAVSGPSDLVGRITVPRANVSFVQELAPIGTDA